jgi:two-component system heavy metal sensor histidine kinase CusS
VSAPSLRRQLTRYAIALAITVLAAQILLFVIVDLTDLHWPPTAWPWMVRERLRHWANHPLELRHELTEFSSLVVIGLLAIPAIVFSVRRFAARLFSPVEAVARRAREICAGGVAQPLPVDPQGAGDEIAAMAGACNLAFARYEEAFRRLERFTRDTSHQLRTPLASLRAAGEVCLNRPRTEAEYRDAIGGMLEQAAHLLSVVETLLDVARRDERDMQAAFQPLDLGALVADSCEVNQEWAEARQVRVRLETGPVQVRGDARLLEQAVVNLVDNAVRASPLGGEVIVRVGGDGSLARIEVLDRGPGLPADRREHLFEPHYRPPAERHAGSGLGLSIVADVVRLHRGEVGADSPPGGGTRFVITLPQDPAPAVSKEDQVGRVPRPISS